MADVFTVKKRSEVMSRIRSSGTEVEALLYSIVREALGGRWRIERNVSALPGRPDIFIPALKLIIFADGCFYHSCPNHGHVPKSNMQYWVPKLRLNVQRDKRNRRALRSLGFSVWRIWEHRLEGRLLNSTRKQIRRRLQRVINSRIAAR